MARFSDHMSMKVLGEVLRNHPFEFRAVITSKLLLPVPAERKGNTQEWFDSGNIRTCQYDGVRWNNLAPLDEKILDRMCDAETVFMDCLARLEWKHAISYATRKRWYLQHLRFWDDYLTRNNINLFLSAFIPHEPPDVLIYCLCRARGIPTLFFHTTLVQDISFSASTWEDPAPRLRERYEELLRIFSGKTKPEDIPLEPLFEARYKSLIPHKAERPGVENVRRMSELDRIKELFWTKPLSFLRNGLAYLSPNGIRKIQELLQRQRIIRERNAFYITHAITPSLDQPFVYFPLHFQPEASTTPLAGRFTEQILVAQMLNAYLPDDVLLYVKEHPRESGWTKRSVQDYRDLLAMKKVRLISRDVDTFALREKCVAVATCSGSAGFEALFRGKPVLLFGSRFYQYANGVFKIRTVEDCQKAIIAIFE
ncbi:MAG: hypothetical protein PHO54_06285, partial [Candidatus Peribacteraceae bacterium]|nr:hypothetical protein [Candidatus Peribacteraceae bacterium]